MATHRNSAIWKIEYLNQTVEAEVLALPADMQARMLRIVGLLETWGPQRVGMPYTRPLGDRLWEIRVSGKAGIGRVVYIVVRDRRLVVLHAFTKKTEKTPRRNIEIALQRAKEITS